MVYSGNVILHICDSTNVPDNKDRSHQCNAEQENLKSTKYMLGDSIYIMYQMVKLTHGDRGEGWLSLGHVGFEPGR